MTDIVLASASPRRRELIARLGVPFQVEQAEVDESPQPGEAPADLAARLSRAKAAAVASRLKHGVVIAADTIVVLNDEVLGKPANADEARAMLRRLRGRAHTVMTAIYLVRLPDGAAVAACVETAVTMRDYSDSEIEAYIATGDPMDKAGAYAIQHAAFHPVEKIAGCYSSVMGLPLCALQRALHTLGVRSARLPAECLQCEDSPCRNRLETEIGQE